MTWLSLATCFKVNAITDTYEDCEEPLTKLNSDCWSFFGGRRLSAIFETTSLDNVALYYHELISCVIYVIKMSTGRTPSLEIPASLVL